MNDIINIIPAKYHSLALFVLATSPYITRAIHSMMNGGGLRSILGAIWLGTNTPKPSSGPAENPAQTKLPLTLMIAIIATGFILSACAPLQPGADPIIVRVEQAETVAKSSFDLVLNVDNSNRAFFATNAPGYHQFCEWLRAPQTVEQTNTLPRAAAMLVSLDDVKLAYKSSRASSNDLFSALTTIQATMNQANAWMTVITNQPTK